MLRRVRSCARKRFSASVDLVTTWNVRTPQPTKKLKNKTKPKKKHSKNPSEVNTMHKAFIHYFKLTSYRQWFPLLFSVHRLDVSLPQCDFQSKHSPYLACIYMFCPVAFVPQIDHTEYHTFWKGEKNKKKTYNNVRD